VSVGVGVGMIEAEYRATGQDFHTRGPRLDEMIEVLSILFSVDQPEYHGRYYDFPPSGFQPKPIQQPRPPILIGGFSQAARRRMVESGDGWFGGSSDPDSAATTIAELQQRRADLGKPPLEITFLTGWSQGYDTELEHSRRVFVVSGRTTSPVSSRSTVACAA